MSVNLIANPDHVQIGSKLWSKSADDFMHRADEQGMSTPDERFSLYTGFLSAACSHASADVGPDLLCALLDQIKRAVNKIHQENIKAVKDAYTGRFPNGDK